MITTLTIASPFLTRNSYAEQHGDNVTIGLSSEAVMAIQWASAKMANEDRVRELAKTHPVVADAVEALHTANEQLKMVVALVK
jgi:hypothetical protein